MSIGAWANQLGAMEHKNLRERHLENSSVYMQAFSDEHVIMFMISPGMLVLVALELRMKSRLLTELTTAVQLYCPES